MVLEMDSKKLMLDKTQEDGYCCSRSSYLPECIVSHILSFLPTEDSVRASFVSKSWKSLLFPLSIIDLDFERFSKNSCLIDQKKQQFAQFVECITLLHKGRHLEELRLAFDISGFEQDHPQIDDWVSFAMTSDTTTLDLDFWGGRERKKHYPDCDDNYYCLPECTLPLQSVEVLRLKYCSFIPSSQDMIFLSIKILVLTAVSLPDDSVHDLIENCPCLEELHLIACILPEDIIIEDLETKLKCLVVDSSEGGSFMYSFDIDIPSLLRFKYVGRMMSEFHIGNSRNLTEAEIKFDDDYYDLAATDEEAAQDRANYFAMLRGVLSHMDNLDSLTISKSCLQVLTLDYDKTIKALIAGHESHERFPPPLPNLKHLSLKSFQGRNYTMNFGCLLKSSPNLETLCIDQSMDELIDPDLMAYLFDHEEEMFWRTYLFPSKFLRNVKKIEIKGFEGRTDEMFLLKIILDHSLVLEEMVISKAAMKSRYASMKRDGNKKKEVKLLKAKQQSVIEKLLTFRRGSSRARILLF